MIAFLRHHLRCLTLAGFSRAALIEELADRRAITPAQAHAIRDNDKVALVHALPSSVLVDALHERELLERDEAAALRRGASLSTHYACHRLGTADFDADAAEAARDAIRRGDLPEALIQAGRALAHLRDLPDLAARAARAPQPRA